MIQPLNKYVLIDPVARENAFATDPFFKEKGVVKEVPFENCGVEKGQTVYFSSWNAERYDEEKEAFWLVPLDKITAVEV